MRGQDLGIRIHQEGDLIRIQTRLELLRFYQTGGDSLHSVLALVDRFCKRDRAPHSQRICQLGDEDLYTGSV